MANSIPQLASYSFLDSHATFNGPSGNYNVGSGSGNAEEGITVEMLGDKDTQTTGADGSIMHSLHASDSAKVTIRLLKSSLVNALLNGSYNSDKQSGLTWGQNNITITHSVLGDVITLTNLAFIRQPPLNYAVEGGLLEWELQGRVDENLG
jgi:hypothetical protein